VAQSHTDSVSFKAAGRQVLSAAFLFWQGDNFSVIPGFRCEKQKILNINFLQ
jgi:hypothetical protein